jgi:hypothetical protein
MRDELALLLLIYNIKLHIKLGNTSFDQINYPRLFKKGKVSFEQSLVLQKFSKKCEIFKIKLYDQVFLNKSCQYNLYYNIL